MKKIEHSELTWRDNAPVSANFGDVYYSAENGLAETNYVFLHGVGAPDIWRDHDHFVIAETGFGTGLNFLATWKAFRESGARGRLTFISVEGYPLTERALEAAHETFPEVAEYAAALRAAWPPAAPGFHKRHFDGGKVNLLLMFGDAAKGYARLNAEVDAWFLDGFAPAKNPEMWSDALFDQIARLSKPGARFATFTAAGFVRRGLIARGFDVSKVKGYGTKRERLVGEMKDKSLVTVQQTVWPEWAQLSPAADGPMAIIGGGIAGASMAYALEARGRDVTVYRSPGHPCASQVPAAILAPRFLLDHQPVAEFFTSAYAYSTAFAPYTQAWAEAHGITMHPKNAKDADRLKAIAKHLDWSDDWLREADDTLVLPRGGSIDTTTALESLLDGVTLVGANVTALTKHADGWRVQAEGESRDFAHVIVAAGIESDRLLAPFGCPPLRPNRGQVEICSASLSDGSLAYGGYLTAAISGQQTLGSTFDRLDTYGADDFQPRPEDRERILATYTSVMGQEFPRDRITGSWAGLRATTPDHLPYAGPAFDAALARTQYAPLGRDANIRELGEPPLLAGLSILTGLGSKGYQYGPMMADYLAASLCGEPLPLPNDLVAAVHPMRGLIRAIIRGQSLSSNS
ncbi:tRNA (5-methylaminomethyl-2-thiouridine)(34)-methyltransferase MnmD [Kordiimonas gwangyangensis]|uniref:tRNA (5-methylaminomethyl-2-thiouridine)(34)-methyltransferase MnmD n=1 Tax=Kordiimonas gwangyangensis TaxID=288022 RepID=UPI00138B103A|nr:tRNA (5-methylaminomethyl-2-thiouridine)(34)-methyltransferase MnmD [Kordiimonas gwangyangensis]